MKSKVDQYYFETITLNSFNSDFKLAFFDYDLKFFGVYGHHIKIDSAIRVSKARLMLICMVPYLGICLGYALLVKYRLSSSSCRFGYLLMPYSQASTVYLQEPYFSSHVTVNCYGCPPLPSFPPSPPISFGGENVSLQISPVVFIVFVVIAVAFLLAYYVVFVKNFASWNHSRMVPLGPDNALEDFLDEDHGPEAISGEGGVCDARVDVEPGTEDEIELRIADGTRDTEIEKEAISSALQVIGSDLGVDHQAGNATLSL
ncbi:hypothetical protein NE237_019110 [Protea cynaroides]|uniref:Uncharacterized protein n=1 Tax=Protea cynaroides TaxID=273540 RepID=A0A9Q0KBD8_9MAGN|nr:hypothetical protein NE237_019110 [Protea cynaroides]